MIPAEIVITAEVDKRTTAHILDPEALAKHLINLLRTKADEEAARVGGFIRTDRMPELDFKQGTLPALGLEFWLLWSKWHAEVPDSELARLPLDVPTESSR